MRRALVTNVAAMVALQAMAETLGEAGEALVVRPDPGLDTSPKPSRKHAPKGGRYMPHQGKREIERRKRKAGGGSK